MRDDRYKTLTTPRLTIRRFVESDHAAFMAVRNHPDVARYQSWTYYSEQQARQFIAGMQYEPCGVPGSGFQYAVELTAQGILIGDCYLKIEFEDPRQAEIGFTFGPEYQGQGFATEAVSAILNYAFGDLGVHRVIGSADARNTRSMALMKRLGMRQEAHFVKSMWFKGEWADDVIYAILEEEWRQRR